MELGAGAGGDGRGRAGFPAMPVPPSRRERLFCRFCLLCPRFLEAGSLAGRWRRRLEEPDRPDQFPGKAKRLGAPGGGWLEGPGAELERWARGIEAE